jgi:primary-amine oxidase
MPVEHTGFHLKPSGFFRRSPGMDVAPSEPKHCCSSNPHADATGSGAKH